MTQDYSDTEVRLEADVKIIFYSEFESGMVKILESKTDMLTIQENSAVPMFEISEPSSKGNEQEAQLNLGQRVMKKRRIDQRRKTQGYMDLRFILPISNICERLFPVAGFVLGGRRRSILSSNLETHMFLHVNSSLSGGVPEVNTVIQKRCDYD